MTDIDQIVQELTDIKQDIQNAKEEKAKCEGALTEQLKTLKSMGIKSVVDGKKKVQILKKEILKLEDDIQTQYIELKEAYTW
jgi:hypothetical protein